MGSTRSQAHRLMCCRRCSVPGPWPRPRALALGQMRRAGQVLWPQPPQLLHQWVPQ